MASMEDNLQGHITALMKSRDEYRALHEKLMLANQLFEERDERARRRASDLQLEADGLRKQLEDARHSIAAQHAQRASFENDVAALSRVAASLEVREQEQLHGMNNLRTAHSGLQEENEKLRKENERLQAELVTMQAELVTVHEQRVNTASRVTLLENTKATLLTQIGNLKISNRRETCSAAKAEQALKEAQTAADRYRDLFETEHAELERYKECLEVTEGQLNDSQREIGEFRDILMQEVGGMALSADGDVDVTVFVGGEDEYPTLDQMASRYDAEPAPADGGSSGSHSKRTPVKAALSAIKQDTDERERDRGLGSVTRVSPAHFSDATALTDDFGYAR